VEVRLFNWRTNIPPVTVLNLLLSLDCAGFVGFIFVLTLVCYFYLTGKKARNQKQDTEDLNVRWLVWSLLADRASNFKQQKTKSNTFLSLLLRTTHSETLEMIPGYWTKVRTNNQEMIPTLHSVTLLWNPHIAKLLGSNMKSHPSKVTYFPPSMLIIVSYFIVSTSLIWSCLMVFNSFRSQQDRVLIESKNPIMITPTDGKWSLEETVLLLFISDLGQEWRLNLVDARVLALWESHSFRAYRSIRHVLGGT